MMKKKILKIFIWFFTVLFLLLAGVFLTTQTRFFKDWLRVKLLEAAAENLNAELQLGTIDGNLISDFQLDDLVLLVSGDTLLYLPSLKFRIVPKNLIRKEVRLKVLAVDSLRLFLLQHADSSWNFEHIVKTDTSTRAPANETAPFQWKLLFENIHFSEAAISFMPLEKMPAFPEKIKAIDLDLDAQYINDVLDVQMRNLSFLTVKPQFAMQRLAFKIKYEKNRIAINALDFATQQSHFSGNIIYEMHDDIFVDFDLTADPFHFDEIKAFVPGFNFYGQPAIKLRAQLAGDSLSYNLQVTEKEQFLTAAGSIADISTFEKYKSHLVAKNIKPGYWVRDDSLQIGFDGMFDLTGSGLAPESAIVQLTASLSSVELWQRHLDSVAAKFSLKSNKLTTRAAISAPLGHINFAGKIADLVGTQKFSFDFAAHKIDLNSIALTDSLDSDINFTINVSGRNLNPDSLECNFEFKMLPSSVIGAKIDTLFSWGSWGGDSGRIDTLHVESPLGRFFLAGNIGIETNNNIQFHGDLGNLQWVQNQISADTLQAAGFFEGHVRGTTNALFVGGKYDFQDIVYNNLYFGQARGDFVTTVANNAIQARGGLLVQKLALSETAMDTVDLTWNFADSVLKSDIYLSRQDTIQSKIRFSYHVQEIPEIWITEFAARLKNLYWENRSKSAQINIGPDYYEFRNLDFQSQNQKVDIDGFWRQKGENDLNIKISGLQIKPIFQLMQFKEEITGQINSDILIEGTAADPQIRGDLKVDNGRIMEFHFEQWQGPFSLLNSHINWDFTLKQDSLRGMKFDGFLPVNVAAAENESFLVMNAPMRIHAINTKRGGLDLSFLQAFFPDMKNVKGRFLANVKVTHTLENPLPAGSVRVFDGRFDIPRYGVRYKNLQLAVQFDSTDIRIQQLELQGGKGRLALSGNLAFDDGIQEGIRAANLNISAKNFQVAKNRDIFMVVDADARFFGDIAKPRFDGDILLRRSTFNLNALENSRYVELEQVQPLLVQARVDTIAEKIVKETKIAKPEEVSRDQVSLYYENLKGELRIEIGRNTWLRSPSLNVEVKGKLLQTKHGVDFEMPVGTMTVVRGSYDFLGKSFKIEQGEFILDGGEEINPLIDLEAIYSIRDEDRNEIRILVSGRALDPEITFYFNNEQIEESNAVSYIVFGRDLEQVSSGEKQDLQSGQLLTQLAAAQLTKNLGKKLSLDVIEFQGKTEADAASSITVGRYISDHIFISIQQLIGGENWETMESLRATLELELMNNIFMQFTKGDEKSTGFDLIWKYQK
ncbi:MAG: AsmA family protein [Calditrichaeota bacterium]|nr:MAG: AsmA family protein [Calditrichota bacterium]